MKNLQCDQGDICFKQIQYKFELCNLREIYQTEGIVQVCEDCGSDINKQLKKLQNKFWNGKLPVKDISKELKNYIIRLRVLGEKSKTKGLRLRWLRTWKRILG